MSAGFLSGSIRTFFRLSNSASEEEAIKLLHERRPDLGEPPPLDGNDAPDLARELELADAYMAEGLDAPAFRLYEELRFRGVTDARMELGLAQVLHRYSDPSALEHVERAVELDPESVAAWELLGRIYLQANRREDALAAWYTACRLDPDNATLLTNIGYSFVLAGDWASARTYLEGAVRIDSPLVQAQNNLGIALARLGDDDGALHAFRAVNPPAAAYNNLGVVYLAQGRKAAAATAFSDAVAIDPSYSLARRNLADLTVGQPWATVVNLVPFETTNGSLRAAAAPEPDGTAWETAKAEPVTVPGSADVAAASAPVSKFWKILDVQLLRPAVRPVISVAMKPVSPTIKSSIPVIFWWIPLFAAAVGLGGAGKRGMLIGSLCGTVGIIAAMFL
jgi:Flp pilus assembly protein TadD